MSLNVKVQSLTTSSSGIQFRTSAYIFNSCLSIFGEIKGLYNSPPLLVVHMLVLLHSAIPSLQLVAHKTSIITSTAAPGRAQLAAMAASMSYHNLQN